MELGLGYDVTSKIMIVETPGAYLVTRKLELYLHTEKDKPSVVSGWSESRTGVPGLYDLRERKWCRSLKYIYPTSGHKGNGSTTWAITTERKERSNESCCLCSSEMRNLTPILTQTRARALFVKKW